jgi:hypothetical protein
LTPYIIRDPGDLREIFERKMQERQQMIDRYFVFGEDKFEPHIDYTRTRGLVSEIVNEIDGVEEEIKLAQAAELEPPPDHVPRSPIGPYSGPITVEEDTYVIGPNGVELQEQTESIPATAADEQEGGGAPPPPIESPHGAEPESPPEPELPDQTETTADAEGTEEIIEPDEPPSRPEETNDSAEPAGGSTEDAQRPSNEESDGTEQ